jgi:hypothetical protein
MYPLVTILLKTRFVIGANNLLDIYPTVNFKTQTVALRASGVDTSGNITFSNYCIK